MARDGFQWDIAKAAANRRKHGVDFAEATVVSVGSDAHGRLLVTVFSCRGDSIRIISSRPATPSEKRSYGRGR